MCSLSFTHLILMTLELSLALRFRAQITGLWRVGVGIWIGTVLVLNSSIQHLETTQRPAGAGQSTSGCSLRCWTVHFRLPPVLLLQQELPYCRSCKWCLPSHHWLVPGDLPTACPLPGLGHRCKEAMSMQCWHGLFAHLSSMSRLCEHFQGHFVPTGSSCAWHTAVLMERAA